MEMKSARVLPILVGALVGALVADSAPTNAQAIPRVQTTLGPVEGRLDGEVHAFTGIPYAEPPVATRRFRAPVPKRPWTAVFNATKPGPLCPQLRMSGTVEGSEDCLTVNVWSPPNAKGLPVMVFLHGGRHMVGGALGGQISFDGARLAEEARVVVFSVEFRFGLLGYLTHPALDADAGSGRSGNYGMLDQLLGLQWVRANARAFGGAPEPLTLFGQSSGSTDVALLLAAPRARGRELPAHGVHGTAPEIRRQPSPALRAPCGRSALPGGAARSLCHRGLRPDAHPSGHSP